MILDGIQHTKAFNKNKETRYKMKQHPKTKELYYYKVENVSFISKLL